MRAILRLDRRLELRDPPVLQLRRPGVVAVALRRLDLAAQVVELLFELGALLNRFLLLRPVRRERALFLLQVGELLLEPGQPLGRGLVGLLAQGLALDLELHHPALHFVELSRHRVDLHAQPRGRLVDQVDGLVGQESVGDVAVREDGRRHQRRVLEADLVVELVTLAQAAQDADGVLDRRLADGHRLEAPLERRVLLDVLAVFVERGRTDGVQLAARQHRLEHVGGVERAFGGPGADHGVELVDEEDDPPFGLDNLLQDGLQTFLELAAVLGPGDQRPHVEGDDALVLQALWHVAADDALGQTLDDGGLADARFADQHRVVLGAARQHLNDAAHLLVTTDDRVELAAFGQFGEVAAVLLQRLVLALGVLVGDPLRATHRLDRRHQRVAGDAAGAEQLGRRRPAALAGDGEEQVLGADELVLHGGRGRLRLFEHQSQARRDPGLGAAVGLGPAAELVAHG